MPVPWMLWVSKVVILKSYRFCVPAMFVFLKETWEGSRLLSTQILRTSNKSFLWHLLSDAFMQGASRLVTPVRYPALVRCRKGAPVKGAKIKGVKEDGSVTWRPKPCG